MNIFFENPDVWYNTLIIILVFLAARLSIRFVVRKVIFLARKNSNLTQTALEGKVKTISTLIQGLGDMVLFLVIILMILNLFGIDIRPMLAGAGIMGLAIGFGTQSLVKDIVSGFFILMEEPFHVGDRVQIGNFEGRVLKLSPRSTVLKDDNGNTIFFPNGSITHVVNVKKKK